MVQAIRDFGDGLRKGLGIRVRCDGCGKAVLHRAVDFIGHIPIGRDIENLRWRCSWCGALATWVRWTEIDRNDREGLAQWPPPERDRRDR